ncbi:alpha-1,2-mannosidase, putative subfamily [Pseudovirgaria hyperparasitica]|uniref:Alpha-1,2-mannosidase, putative subfamily n=1 Tax=Pseudovirgaria hyperparasitica TaxID=470096 RepID=A0A6A6W1D6_9PEZI|nr:alpha-1,2-mannosidase, putative subfamily [Pseudovirgaria hyperparasitica]KAF2754861.1 alpha-1,2-mannosidase, putative subfamily [Pseudovirgaria hyperparasitica]
MGFFPLFAHAGCPSDDIEQCKFTKSGRAAAPLNETIEARVGYFAITLNNSVRAEMTVAEHAALYRFNFPQALTNVKSSPLILADLTDLSESRSNASIHVDNVTGRIIGSGNFGPSFGIGTYNAFFCTDFSGASIRDTGIFVNIRPGPGIDHVDVFPDGVNPSGIPAGAWSRFEAPANGQILARVGVSFISVEQACSNAEKELPDFDFDGTVESVEKSWDLKLSSVEVDASAVDEELQTVFWSGLYRTLISPQDYTGENPYWDSGLKYYDSFYCIWDSFRSIHPLITLVDPVAQTEMVASLIDIYNHVGKLPDCRMTFDKGFTQGGSNADIVLADAWLKNLTGDIDWEKAYEAVISDAEEEPPIWSVEGRGSLHSWHEYGFIPTDDFDYVGVGAHTRSISRTVEYAYDDFCIAEMARGMGKSDDIGKYFARSHGWKNMFKADQTSAINGTDTGFVGFLQPRFMNMTWGFEDPIFCSELLNFTSCYLNPNGGETYESPSWLYTWFVPGDMATLIDTLGGPDVFVNRLDYFHEYPIIYMGNEPSFLTVFLYHFAGRPALSAKRAHSYIPSQFNTSLNGIPGNDDSGAMGSFSTLAMMGTFPNPGQNVYFITPPFFAEVKLKNGVTGKTATIRNINFDPTYNAIYIQSATMDGEPYTKNWMDHGFFTEGKTLELTLGATESDWGTRYDDLPPSLSTGGPPKGLRDM